MNRAERRRRERAEAKLYKRINQSYDQADQLTAELEPSMRRMLEVAVRRGWDDVAQHVTLAIDALHAGEGLRMQSHMNDAAKAIDAHKSPEP